MLMFSEWTMSSPELRCHPLSYRHHFLSYLFILWAFGVIFQSIILWATGIILSAMFALWAIVIILRASHHISRYWHHPLSYAINLWPIVGASSDQHCHRSSYGHYPMSYTVIRFAEAPASELLASQCSFFKVNWWDIKALTLKASTSYNSWSDNS